MDTSPSVIIGALATIIAALMGAIATIVAALIKQKTDHHQTPEFVHTISAQDHLTEKCVLEIRENSAIIIPEIELTIAILLVILDDRVNFEYRVRQQASPTSVKNAGVGWQNLFTHDQDTFALTLIKIDGLGKKIYFDFRRIAK